MRMKLTDRRIEKLRSKSTIEVWDTDLRGFGIRINRGGKRTFNVLSLLKTLSAAEIHGFLAGALAATLGRS